MKRQRGRSRNNNNNNNRNNNHNNQNRALDSNGPEVKVRGTASTIYEKYTTLARDAQSSGNRVKAENLRQHAEHYLRIMNVQEAAKQAALREREAAQQERDAAQQERDAARAARGETNETGSDTDERKPRKQHSRRNHRDKDDASKSEIAKSETAESDSETPKSEKPKSEKREPKESSSEQALEVIRPEANNDTVAEEAKAPAKPKSRRKAPARKDEAAEAVDAAE